MEDLGNFRGLHEVPKTWSELKELRGDFEVPSGRNMG